MKPKPDGRAQAERFYEAARVLGADEDEAAFKAKLAVIGKQKPVAEEKSTKTRTNKRSPS